MTQLLTVCWGAYTVIHNQYIGNLIISGNALGDAYGLATEFWKKEDVDLYYKDKPVPFPYFLRTKHSKGWSAGDW